MTTRTRKLIGALFMVPFVVVYALVAMVLAQPVLKINSGLLRLAVFAALGLGWAVPMIPLIRWMEKKDD